MPDTPASKAGIKAGDVLIEIDGKVIRDLRGYSQTLGQYRPGDRIKLTVDRAGKRVELEAKRRSPLRVLILHFRIGLHQTAQLAPSSRPCCSPTWWGALV